MSVTVMTSLNGIRCMAVRWNLEGELPGYMYFKTTVMCMKNVRLLKTVEQLICVRVNIITK
jgi:hypothetical protein